MCRVSTCCCGCSLKDGTTIIAVLNIIGAIGQLIMLISGAGQGQGGPGGSEMEAGGGPSGIVAAIVSLAIGAVLLYGARYGYILH